MSSVRYRTGSLPSNNSNNNNNNNNSNGRFHIAFFFAKRVSI